MVKFSESKVLVQKCDLIAQALKSLGHPVRLKILCELIASEKTVGELTEFCEISQSAMSQFLNRMKEEGLVKSRRDSTFVFYSVADHKLIQLLRAIKEIYC